MNDLSFEFTYEEYETLKSLIYNSNDWNLKQIATKVKDAYDNRRFIKGETCPHFELLEVGKDCGKYNDCEYCEINNSNELFNKLKNFENKCSSIWRLARNALYELEQTEIRDTLREIMEIANGN